MGKVLRFAATDRGGDQPPGSPAGDTGIDELGARRLRSLADLAQALSCLTALQRRGLVPPAAITEGWSILQDLVLLEIPRSTGPEAEPSMQHCIDVMRRIADRLQIFHETYTAQLPATE